MEVKFSIRIAVAADCKTPCTLCAAADPVMSAVRLSESQNRVVIIRPPSGRDYVSPEK